MSEDQKKLQDSGPEHEKRPVRRSRSREAAAAARRAEKERAASEPAAGAPGAAAGEQGKGDSGFPQKPAGGSREKSRTAWLPALAGFVGVLLCVGIAFYVYAAQAYKLSLIHI